MRKKETKKALQCAATVHKERGKKKERKKLPPRGPTISSSVSYGRVPSPNVYEEASAEKPICVHVHASPMYLDICAFDTCSLVRKKKT